VSSRGVTVAGSAKDALAEVSSRNAPSAARAQVIRSAIGRSAQTLTRSLAAASLATKFDGFFAHAPKHLAQPEFIVDPPQACSHNPAFVERRCGMDVIPKDNVAVLNVCAKYLARDDRRVSDAWRFPIVDAYSDGTNFTDSYAYNDVTFVYGLPGMPAALSVGVVGTFANLYDPLPLRVIADTPFWTVSVKVPKGEVHTYKFIVDGVPTLDPINPQRATLENGREWSRFFTQLASQPISFERWELKVLDRLTCHILPFRTEAGENFLRRFYFDHDRATRETQYAHAYRLDQPVGVVNFIDKVVAREESQYLIDYKLCLRQIDRVLRQRNPYVEPGDQPAEAFVDLYDQMWQGTVRGWDYSQYGNPKFFVQLLRRHTMTGAFSHPKYGGNGAAAGWAYLEERFRDPKSNDSLFNWRRITEQPLGTDPVYRG
jgi:hypothetical protein